MDKSQITVYDGRKDFGHYVFVDRDGVINVERGDYTTTVDQWTWATGAIEGIRLLTKEGFGVIVITNQSCIARGIQTEDGLAALHGFMVDTIRRSGGMILAVYHCPHRTDDNCDCRKPKPGMILRAAEDYEIALAETFMIGDAVRDMEAATRVGTRTVFIEGTPASEGMEKHIEADFRAADLLEAARIVVREIRRAQKRKGM